MNVTDVQTRVTNLFNPDGSQDTEENLYRDVLQAIAGGAENPNELAKAVIAGCDRRGN